MALKHVYYHVRNELLVQVRYRIQDAWGWCTGMTQRDDMGRVVGGGFRVGNSCTPVVDPCQCMAKPIQYCKEKKIKFKLKKSPPQKIFKVSLIILSLLKSCTQTSSQTMKGHLKGQLEGTLKSSPAPQVGSINSLVLSLLYGPSLTFIHDYWKNCSFDYTDHCGPSDDSAFFFFFA